MRWGDEKAQGTAALQDASTFSWTLLLPEGFGVRLSPAAFSLGLATVTDSCDRTDCTIARLHQALPNLPTWCKRDMFTPSRRLRSRVCQDIQYESKLFNSQFGSALVQQS